MRDLVPIVRRRQQPISPGRNSRLRPGQLFLVGDPKQSVYRFRRADIRCYKQAKAAIQRQCPENVLAVTDNFRSRQPILDFVNQRFAAPLSSIGYEPLVCTIAPSGEAGISIGRIPIGKEDSEYKVYEWRELEAQAVAQLCQQLIGGFTVRENKELVPLPSRRHRSAGSDRNRPLDIRTGA